MLTSLQFESCAKNFRWIISLEWKRAARLSGSEYQRGAATL